MKTNIKLILLILLLPAISSAQGRVIFLLSDFRTIVNLLPRILLGLSTIYFLWGVSQFILNSADDKSRQMGKQKMIWGVVALFVFVSVFGILAALENLIGIDSSATPIIYGTPFNPSPSPGTVIPNNP